MRVKNYVSDLLGVRDIAFVHNHLQASGPQYLDRDCLAQISGYLQKASHGMFVDHTVEIYKDSIGFLKLHLRNVALGGESGTIEMSLSE